MEQKLNNLYTTPGNPSSFSGLKSFEKQIKSKNFKKSAIKQWMINHESYSLHKPLIKKFPRNKVIVSGIDDIWQADLVDVSSISKENNSYKFLLTCIDVFSKYAWVLPLKNKTSHTVLEAFKKIITSNRKPNKIQTDKGTEFLNKEFKNYLNSINVQIYTTNSELKASVIERFNRTIKQKMWRYFTYSNKYIYLHVLDKLINSYNNSYHTSIKTKPILVDESNQDKVWSNLYGYDKNIGDESLINVKYKINDKVRISKNKTLFEKGYTPNWTREIFIIDKILIRNPPVYELKDLNDELIEGTFYEQELHKINKLDELYKIEKILKTKKLKNKTKHFVKWLGYPESFNSWIDAENINNL